MPEENSQCKQCNGDPNAFASSPGPMTSGNISAEEKTVAREQAQEYYQQNTVLFNSVRVSPAHQTQFLVASCK